MATATEITTLCRNYINGEWVESKSPKIVERRNPANIDEVVARIPLSTRQEMKEAIAAAKMAFPAWRDTPAPARGKILFKAVRIMEEQKEELARLLTREEGKALKDSLGEVQRSINITEFMAGEARRLNGETTAERIAEEFLIYDSPAARCGRRDYAVEFSGGYSRVENCACSGVRQYGGIQAGDFDAAYRHESCRDFRAGGTSARSAESGDGLGTRYGR